MGRDDFTTNGNGANLKAQLNALDEKVRQIGSSGETASTIIAKLLQDDELGAWDRCCQWLESEYYLLDPNALMLRTLAWVTYSVELWDRKYAADQWFADMIAKSAASLIDDEAALLSSDSEDLPQSFGSQARCWFLTRTLGIKPKDALLACVKINTRADGDRALFLGATQNRSSLADLAIQIGVPKFEARMRFREIATGLGVMNDRIDAMIQLQGEEPNV
jgi:hypothetical protein